MCCWWVKPPSNCEVNKMSESQSRYSIIERLSEKKLQIIDEMNDLDTKPQKKKLDAKNMELRKNEELQSLRTELKEKESEYNTRIVILKEEAVLLENSKSKRLKALNEKLKELTNSMKSLKAISESASKE